MIRFLFDVVATCFTSSFIKRGKGREGGWLERDEGMGEGMWCGGKDIR